MLLDRVTHPSWLSNTWLLADRPEGTAVVVDAGGPAAPLLEKIRDRKLHVTHVLLTHHHHDHTQESRAIASATGAKVCAHRGESELLGGVDAWLEDGATIAAGGLSIDVLHIPGHTRGQAAYLVNGEVCFTGDTLFRGSVGSTTAPGHTTFADLRRSLERLMSLPDATQVAPGHAEPTTVGAERRENPFVRAMLGLAAAGSEPARYRGQEVTLLVWARDYDGGHKAWVRFADGREATVPGSHVERRTS